MTDFASGNAFEIGRARSPIEVARLRLLAIIAAFFVAFMLMMGRVMDLGISSDTVVRPSVNRFGVIDIPAPKVARANIVDRKW